MKNATPPFFLSVFWCDLPQAVSIDLDNPPTPAQIDDGRRRADILSARYAFGKYYLLMLSAAAGLYAAVLGTQRDYSSAFPMAALAIGIFVIACRFHRAQEPDVDDFNCVEQDTLVSLGHAAHDSERVSRYLEAVTRQGRSLTIRECRLLDESLKRD